MPFAQRIAALSTTALLATAALTAAAAPAHAAADRTASLLVLSVEPEFSGPPRATALRCGPAGGPHPHAATACRDVAAVNGDLGALDVDPGLCTLEYAPVTARAWGLWQDRPVSYTETFANRCELRRATGLLFAF